MDNFRESRKKTGKVITKVKSNQNSDGGITKTVQTTVKKLQPVKPKKVKKGSTVGGVLLSALFPLMFGMKKMLAKKGLATKGMTQKAIVATFHNEFVSKKNDKVSNFEEISISDFENNLLFKTPASEIDKIDNLGADTVASVIGGVVGYFKKAKAKRKAAKAKKLNPAIVLTEEENTAGEIAEKVVKDLEKKEEAEKPVENKTFSKYIIIGIVVVVLAVVVYMFTKK